VATLVSAALTSSFWERLAITETMLVMNANSFPILWFISCSSNNCSENGNLMEESIA
jgi:hypothetical protein